MSAAFSQRTRNRDRMKWAVAILLALLLLAALFLRGRFRVPVVDTPEIDVSQVAEQVPAVPAVEGGVDGALESVTDATTGLTNTVGNNAITNDANDAVEDAQVLVPASLANFNEPIVNSAVVGHDGDGNELMTIAGAGDVRCESIRFIIDGRVVGTTMPEADGNWAMTIADLPKAGEYMSEIECDAEGNVYTATPRSFQLPEAPVAEVVANSAETEPDAETVTTDNSDQTAESSDEDAGVNPDDTVVEETQDPDTPDEQPLADSNVVQPEFFIAQDLLKYKGGPIRITGKANRGQIIEVVFDNGSTQVSDTATADDGGNWALRAILTEPGTYSVRAQLAGTSAEPGTSVTVPDGIIFGSKGNCIGKTPPYGTVEGNAYIVNHCEFFSLIADRLGVSFAELRAANQQIINLDYITAGDRINIP